MHHAANARWSVVLRRVAESLARLVLPLGALFLLLLLAAASHLYPFFHETFPGFKGRWFAGGFFLFRALLYLALWSVFASSLVRLSKLQDETRQLALTGRMRRLAVAFVPVFAVSFSLASFEWLGGFEPEWVSTVFVVYVFAGTFTAGLSAVVLLVVDPLHRGVRGAGPLAPYVREPHLHDLGKLLFAFATFWAYIWFCQYMLIWYANIPEEASFFVKRLSGLGEPLFILNLFLNWGVAFLALLPRSTKENPKALRAVALVLLSGHWLDLYLVVFPALGWTAIPTPVELLLALGVAMFCAAAAFRFLRSQVVPVGDPFLGESRQHPG